MPSRNLARAPGALDGSRRPHKFVSPAAPGTSRCKGWYSDRWRDLLLAFAHWLAQSNDTITLTCGHNAPIEVGAQPRIYLSDVRLLAPMTALP
jgi:hypothetical protein